MDVMIFIIMGYIMWVYIVGLIVNYEDKTATALAQKIQYNCI